MPREGNKKRSLLHRAFHNQYNYILMGAAGLFSIVTFTWLPLLVGAGVEALWLVLGADSSPFKRWVAIQESLEARREIEQRAKDALGSLDPPYLARFRELERLSERIQELANQNPSFETQLIQGEMDKLGKLLHSFLEMAITHQRLGHYLQDNDETEMRAEIESTEHAIRHEQNAEVLAGLRQSLALAQKRLKQHQSIDASFRLLGVKMDTLEKSFRYLESHVVAISEREELSQEIDELILGVDAVSEISDETAGTLAELRAAPPSQRPAPVAKAAAAQQRIKN
ncbi:MAG TPA: hypothetical protein VLX92_21330 [Kofleriaceae bacterium]|nr:hypothetical protein [Kofleriaceae bacterium]